MSSLVFLIFLAFIFLCSPLIAFGKEIPKIAVWDLEPRNTPETHAR